MKTLNQFIEEAAKKRCPEGQYWCYTDKKCKSIPKGWHVMRSGYLARDEDQKKKNGNGKKNGSNGNGHSNGGNGNGNGGNGNGGNGNGGGNGGGGE